MKAKKSLGQHFLMHARIAERIALAAPVSAESTVLEIGPGTGMLTRELLKRAKKVIAIEADHELYEKLQNDFSEEIASGRLELIRGDIRTYLPKKGKYHVVANIPYYITGEILKMFLTTKRQPASMTLLVQKEVAERVVGNPERSRGTRDAKGSILSLSVKAYGTPRYAFTVKRGAFIPAPSVDSAVLTISGISRKHFASPEEESRFFDLIRAGFAHKRKYVRSNLAHLVNNSAFEDAKISEKARAEDLALSQWLALSRREG